MAKRFYEKTASFKDENGVEHIVRLYTTSTRYRNTEHAECDDFNAKGTYYWVNRPWQRFDYCSAMENMIEKLPPYAKENATRKLIKGEEERIKKECDKFMTTLQNNYNSLSEKSKKMLSENTPQIENEAQANAVASIVGAMAILGL